jgi:hypothetical protein
MMWFARLKPLVAVAAVLILAIAGVAVQGRQQTKEAQEQAKGAPPPAATVTVANKALARKQLALIDEAEATLRQLARDGRMNIADATFSLWGRRRLEALHRAGAGKAEIVAALEKYINTLEQEEAIAKAQVQAARGTLVGVNDVQFRRMEAEIWLNEEKAR